MHKRLSESGIEYLDYSWGIFSGCRNLEVGICQVKACWAKGLALHYPKIYPAGFEPHYYPEAIHSPMRLKKLSRIAVGWVGDVIGYGLAHKEEIFDTIYNCSQHTFLFLTKNPERLLDWGKFPDNAWVGVTATDYDSFYRGAIYYLPKIQAKVKYISFEPLLGGMGKHIKGWLTACLIDGGIDWVIIGAQTKPTIIPKIDWVREIVKACDQAGVKVFLKNSLKPLVDKSSEVVGLTQYGSARLRQEFPHG